MLKKKKESIDKEILLFCKLNKCMQTECLFADSGLNRKKLADYLNTNEIYLANAIRRKTGETFSEYILNLRLQNALSLLEKYPNIRLEAVATDSGYGSYSQFFRSFIKKYGIAPSKYRKLSNKKENETIAKIFK